MINVKSGAIRVFVAYLLWGLAPIFFKQVATVPALEVLAHRIFWSVPTIMLLLLLFRQPPQWREIWSTPSLRKALFFSALCVSANWFLFVWAVAQGRILDTSLGYFINPLFTIALGVIFLRESLSRLQRLALALAVAGVVWQVLAIGHLPWISLSLAFTFGLYGFLRKRTAVTALDGLLVETAMLLPVALGYLLYVMQQQSSHWNISTEQNLWLMACGLMTVIPLALFASGARRIPMSLLGFLQYTSPSCTFLLALFVYDEPLGASKWLSFGLIWIGLLLIALDSHWRKEITPSS